MGNETGIKIKKIKMKELIPTKENPNKMRDKDFNTLTKTIQELGYDQPMKVWFNKEKNKYEISKGNHRYWALKVAGFDDNDKVECVVGEYKNRDEMLKDLVKDNIVRGKLSPEKFTKLWDKLSQKYGKDMTRQMFDFIDEEQLDKLIKSVRTGLPDEMKEKLDEAKDEIQTIDDLSYVLNRIFAEHGDTLDYNFMVFDYLSGGEIVYIKASKENWKKIEEITKYCRDNKVDINKVIKIDYDG